MTNKSLVAIGSVAALLIVSMILSWPFKGLEEQVLDARYRLRGEVQADTNIVILYFDNDDIASLGGWPLRRNYYALLIDVLTKSGVSAIGLEVFFGEPNLQYPEHDNLLATVAAASGRVVASSYFRHVNTDRGFVDDSLPPRGALIRSSFTGLSGSHLQLPYPELAHAVAGIGHTNLIEGESGRIPVVVAVNSHVVPAFAIQLLRLFYRVEVEDTKANEDHLVFSSPTGERRIPYGADGVVALNYPGPLGSFTRYRCVEVLRSFELQNLGIHPSVDLASLRNKIVLVGVIGEGRSPFFATPFDRSFPSIAVHATLADNALQDRFLAAPGLMATAVISLFFVILVIFSIDRVGLTRALALILLAAVLYIGVSQWLFSSYCLMLPVVQPLVVIVVGAAGVVLYDRKLARRRVSDLERAKEGVEGQLRAREIKLQELERELLDHARPGPGSSQPEADLLNEIKRYKQEIKALSTQVSDLVRYEPAESGRDGERAIFEGIVYRTGGKMEEVVGLIRKIAASDANVLILGESGTGKELVARAIHSLSARHSRPFVAVNCGALTETLLESELFGHEKGSFTGAVREKVGRFEYADGGTIFLDEIAETSEAFQVKLLRVVQHGEFERVGSTVTTKVNTRIVAATNRDVRKFVQEKKFREDLFYRLNVFLVDLPPLRDRRGDIPLLAEHFLQREKSTLAISSTVMDAFLQYHWPGNVRELESALKRAHILAASERRALIQIRDIPQEIAAVTRAQVDLEDQILELLRSKKFSRSSISETAEELGGLNRGTVAEYLRGICFKYFFESLWDKKNAVRSLANNDEAEVIERVRKKLDEYLSNVVEGLRPGQGFEAVKSGLRSKYKNLPHRYHSFLDEVIRSYLLGKWQ